ncbi:MAG: hypothetical protein JSW09_02165 [Pseudomonadota bacterium]|nr:MAG: hypothetical protein JSW09_02165 [Pseudomonadota bacterium]
MTIDLSNTLLDASQREALVSLTALYFIEDHALLRREQLDDARQSLQALFLRTSGEETMLRKLIETLKATRRIHQSFTAIAGTIAGVSKCAVSLGGKIKLLREQLEIEPVSAQENEVFVGPFLAFSHEFVSRIEALHRGMQEYLTAKENESRSLDVFRIARTARDQLKRRLAGQLGSEMHGAFEAQIKREVVASFDFSEAEVNLKFARRESRNREAELREQLLTLKRLSQMAMNPRMRERMENRFDEKDAGYDDIFTRFADAVQRYPRLDDLKTQVVELFRMYQRAYGMLSLDFEHLGRAAETMVEDANAYFEAKEEDADLLSKRERLRLIEALIPFLEAIVEPLRDEELDVYYKFSRRVSQMISTPLEPWESIADELLRAKVQAEAELSTRI